MNAFTIFGLMLLAVLGSLGVGLFTLFNRPALTWRQFWTRLFLVLESEFGAVGVLYYCRGGGVLINGSSTPPTAVQANSLTEIKALVTFGVTADVQALITHDWGLDTSAPTYYDPFVAWYQISDGTYAPSLTVDVSNTNVVKINKAAANQPITVLVTLRKGSLQGGPWA